MSGHSGSPSPQAEECYADSTTADWWEPQGRFSALQVLNPLRLACVQRYADGIADKSVLDIGCGGGLLAEAMALRGARVTGLDIAAGAIAAAVAHAPPGLALKYVQSDVQQYLSGHPEHSFDVVVCMELLEHVADPGALVQSCRQALVPGGTVIFSTLNRSPVAWLAAIIGAEYLFGLVPMGTHDYQRFLRPAELAALVHNAGMQVLDIRGIVWLPLLRRVSLCTRPAVNYLLAATLPQLAGSGQCQ